VDHRPGDPGAGKKLTVKTTITATDPQFASDALARGSLSSSVPVPSVVVLGILGTGLFLIRRPG
jgi:hypothetical protein